MELGRREDFLRNGNAKRFPSKWSQKGFARHRLKHIRGRAWGRGSSKDYMADLNKKLGIVSEGP